MRQVFYFLIVSTVCHGVAGEGMDCRHVGRQARRCHTAIIQEGKTKRASLLTGLQSATEEDVLGFWGLIGDQIREKKTERGERTLNIGQGRRIAGGRRGTRFTITGLHQRGLAPPFSFIAHRFPSVCRLLYSPSLSFSLLHTFVCSRSSCAHSFAGYRLSGWHMQRRVAADQAERERERHLGHYPLPVPCVQQLHRNGCFKPATLSAVCMTHSLLFLFFFLFPSRLAGPMSPRYKYKRLFLHLHEMITEVFETATELNHGRITQNSIFLGDYVGCSITRSYLE